MPTLLLPLLLCVVGMSLAGCAPARIVPAPSPAPAALDAHPVYVLAPSSYSRYLDNVQKGALLASEGEEENLPVYPSAGKARAAMDAQVAAKRLPAGLWRVYRLEGTWEEDVVEPAPGEKRMRRPARLLPAEENEARPLSPPSCCVPL